MVLRRIGADPGQDDAGSDGGVRLLQLADQRVLELEVLVKMLTGEEHAQVDLVVLAADPVDAAMPLHDAHGVPRQVVVDQPPRLLQIDTFGQDIGREEDVELVVAERQTLIAQASRRSRREPGDGSGTRALVDAPGLAGGVLADDGGREPAPVVRQWAAHGCVLQRLLKPIMQVANRVGIRREHDHLAAIRRAEPLGACSSRHRGDGLQLRHQAFCLGFVPLCGCESLLPDAPQQLQVERDIGREKFGVIVVRRRRLMGLIFVERRDDLVQVFRFRVDVVA